MNHSYYESVLWDALVQKNLAEPSIMRQLCREAQGLASTSPYTYDDILCEVAYLLRSDMPWEKVHEALSWNIQTSLAFNENLHSVVITYIKVYYLISDI